MLVYNTIYHVQVLLPRGTLHGVHMGAQIRSLVKIVCFAMVRSLTIASCASEKGLLDEINLQGVYSVEDELPCLGNSLMDVYLVQYARTYTARHTQYIAWLKIKLFAKVLLVIKLEVY